MLSDNTSPNSHKRWPVGSTRAPSRGNRTPARPRALQNDAVKASGLESEEATDGGSPATFPAAGRTVACSQLLVRVPRAALCSGSCSWHACLTRAAACEKHLVDCRRPTGATAQDDVGTCSGLFWPLNSFIGGPDGALKHRHRCSVGPVLVDGLETEEVWKPKKGPVPFSMRSSEATANGL